MVLHPHQPQPAHPGDTISEIGGYLAGDLEGVKSVLHGILNSESRLIREVGDYICLANGKKLRPMLTLLVARAFGLPGGPPPVEVAAALEAVHVATLLHDDVIDKAQLRRGRPSVNARWGDDVAILMADFLYASAFELAIRHLDAKPLRLICQVTQRMCEGEMFQIERRGNWLSPDDYLHIISCKTAYLFSACAGMGGMVAGLPAESIAQASSFGLEFGLAFQITDDMLDFTASDEQWGKAVGIDLASGKQTLPIILALQDAAPDDRTDLEALLRGESYDLGRVRRILNRYDAIERSLEVARGYARQCLSYIDGFEVRDATALEFLTALPEYVVARRY